MSSTTLGAIELSGSRDSFTPERAAPSSPGSRQLVNAEIGRPQRTAQTEALAAHVEALTDAAIERAERQTLRLRNSTTLAALALAYEAGGREQMSVATANEALDALEAESANDAVRGAVEISGRLALEVLVRAGAADVAFERSKRVPLKIDGKAAIAGLLGAQGRSKLGLALLGDDKAEERAGVRGYLRALDSDFSRAIPELRAALRVNTRDADSAFNLSICFGHLGNWDKAYAAARRATRMAPDRADISLHYLEILLSQRDVSALQAELKSLRRRGVAFPARLIVIEARSNLLLQKRAHAVQLLQQALRAADEGGDTELSIEVRSNLVRLRFNDGTLSRAKAIGELDALHAQYPSSEVVVVCLARLLYRTQDALKLKVAFNEIREHATPQRAAFIEHEIAVLSGDNAGAISSALNWVKVDPSSIEAVNAAAVALGIGAEQWAEASIHAKRILEIGADDVVALNNAAYVLAMAGEPETAIAVLRDLDHADYVLRATLGLAYLAADDIDKGMRLYRDAASQAERDDPAARSLMTAYQGLVVRQLGLLNSADKSKLAALSLPEVEAPDDWRDRPDFVRLYRVGESRGLSWPFSV